jgi:AraC-like DNA-binding protein
MANLTYFAPAPELRAHVSSYYAFTCDQPEFLGLMRAELPQLRLVLRGEAVTHYARGHSVGGLDALLQGPTFQPSRFVCKGPLRVFGAGLLPRGWAALIAQPADGLADSAAPLDSIFGEAAAELLAAIATAPDHASLPAIMDSFVRLRLRPLEPATEQFIALTDAWLTDSRAPKVEDLVDATGLSLRSVERLCRRHYGATPKLLARKYRALSAAVRIGTGEAKAWTEVGDAFYDQAHFIREFKQFMGKTPSRFMDESALLTRLTIARKQLMPDLPPLALYS